MRAAAQSVSGRLTGAFSTLVVLLLLVGAAGGLGLVVTRVESGRELRLDQLDDANTQMLLAMADAETGVRGYGLTQDRAFLEPYQLSRHTFPRRVADARAASTSASERALVQRQVDLADDWLTTYAEPVAAMPPGRVVVSTDRQLANKRTFDRLRAANSALADLLTADQRAARSAEHRAWWGCAVLTALALALALAVALVTARRTHRVLVAPLSALADVLADLSAGGHASRADASGGPDEVRAVARSVNELADRSDRLRGERDEAARLQELATEIARSIGDHILTDSSVQEAVSRVGQALGAERAWVRLLRDGDLGRVEAQWHAPGLANLAGEAEQAVAGPSRDAALLQRLFAQRVVWCHGDVLAASASDPEVAAVARRRGTAALLTVPVGAGESVLGTLSAAMVSGPRSWSPHEVALVQSVAADLGRALVLTQALAQQEDVVRRLRELDRTKTDFVATVSHELRTPLTSISGYLELIRDGSAGEVPSELDALLAVVERNTARLRSLIEDLLTLSRIESGAFRVNREEVRLPDVMAGAVAAVRPAAKGAGLDLQVAPVPGGLLVLGDAVQLERVLVDVLSNAVKFTPAGGSVRLRAWDAGRWAVLEVTDTGIGIPEAELSQLSSRFFRATNATTRAVRGTGLGLTIVRSIVEHHGGQLEVTSREGAGTTVVVRLPLVGEDAVGEDGVGEDGVGEHGVGENEVDEDGVGVGTALA